MEEVQPVFDIYSPNLPPSLAVPFGLMENAYRRLTRLVEGMSQAELEYTGPAGNRNSTAMLLQHMALVDLEYLHRVMGQELPPALAAEFGPYETEEGYLPVVTGKAAVELLAQYQRVLELVRTHLSTLAEADAERPVTIPWWPQPATIRYILWHMASHSMFHQGQITRLRAHYAQTDAGTQA